MEPSALFSKYSVSPEFFSRNDCTVEELMNSSLSSLLERDFSAALTSLSSFENDVELGWGRFGLGVVTLSKRSFPIETKLLATTGFMSAQ